MISMLYKSYTFRSLLSVSISIVFIYFIFIADHRFIPQYQEITSLLSIQQNYKQSIPHLSRRLSSNDVESPFMSEFCYDFIDDPELTLLVKHISTIMIIHNENKNGVIKSLESILKNSALLGDNKSKVILENIIIIDDFSYEPVSSWIEWTQLQSQYPTLSTMLEIIRLPSHKGTVYAKNFGVEQVSKHYKELANVAVIFLDAHILVSPHWLIPISNSLTRYPKALVYPILDVLLPQSSSNAAAGESVGYYEGIVKADMSLVAAFDWALQPRWESMYSADGRVKGNVVNIMDSVESTIEVISPSAPGIFAIKLEYFIELGKFDASLYSNYYNPSESVELSLRAWLCGGMVLRQSCSRVAHMSSNLFKDIPVGHGTTQDGIDQSTINIAQKWLQGSMILENNETGQTSSSHKIDFTELVFRARFVKRIPYGVELSVDSMYVSPPQSIMKYEHNKNNKPMNSKLNVCLPFVWYLQEVYPGLLLDGKEVNQQFAEYISTNYLEQQQRMKQLLLQYNKKSELNKNNDELLMLINREKQLQNNIQVVVGAGNAVADHLTSIKRTFKEPPEIKGISRQELLETHMETVRNDLICKDFKEPDHKNNCLLKTSQNPNWCTLNKADSMFTCPETCGFCGVEDGKFCEDFYLKKCPAWKNDNQCETTDSQYGLIKEVCRKSCNMCTPKYMSEKKLDTSYVPPIVLNVGHHSKQQSKQQQHFLPVPLEPPLMLHPPRVEEQKDLHVLSELEKQQLKVNELLHQPMTIDATFLHNEFLNGNVPDIIDGNDVVVSKDSTFYCNLKDNGNSKILSRVQLHQPQADNKQSDPPVKIFCGIYTMEGNHHTNTKATRNTWAKRCDGFIAFSTKEDASIPSINIIHEGPESYDNMWQKSRSIWKYINAHLVNEYDYFLLGGDDMFYIIENLRAYLGSDEITKLQMERNGLYLGRVFQPPNQLTFNSGGAGYILDKKSVKILGENIDSPKCYPHQQGFWEDVNVANCLKKSDETIVPYDTRDSLERERFHPFSPSLHLAYRIPATPDWYAKYNPNLKLGFECCSQDSISFHYVKETLLYELYNYMYHCKH